MGNVGRDDNVDATNPTKPIFDAIDKIPAEILATDAACKAIVAESREKEILTNREARALLTNVTALLKTVEDFYTTQQGVAKSAAAATKH